MHAPLAAQRIIDTLAMKATSRMPARANGTLSRLALLAALLLPCASPSWAATIGDALRSYEAGSYAEAAAAFDALAAGGDATAQYYLGIMHAAGQHYTQDTGKAMEWFRKAADSGSPAAQFKLGLAHAEGIGVEPDPVAAANWFRKSATQGHPQAQFYLGVAYQHGQGIMQDSRQAARWFYEAAKQGIPEAQVNLGYLYGEGEGVPKDPVQAYAWFSIAAAGGDQDAQENKILLERSLSREELDAARKLTRTMMAELFGAKNR